jgi:hypothetical protein
MEMTKIDVEDPRIHGFLVLYDMHTEFFRRSLDGITDGAAQSRLDTQANHIAWLAGSLVQQRFELASRFGGQMQQTAFELFSENKPIKDGVAYPPLRDFIDDWNKISPILRERLMMLPKDKLDTVFTDMGMRMSYFEFISFCIYREANIIGQIALWRRLLNYPALKYD